MIDVQGTGFCCCQGFNAKCSGHPTCSAPSMLQAIPPWTLTSAARKFVPESHEMTLFVLEMEMGEGAVKIAEAIASSCGHG